jgi:hypothetical protein
MNRERIQAFAYTFLALTPILGFFSYAFGDNPYETIFMILGITLVIYLISFIAKPEPTEWTCQQCHAKLVRKQIKFGLCPYCGVKVKGFRGLRPYSLF